MTNKWYGKVGFATTVEGPPGIWKDEIVEDSYYGDFQSMELDGNQRAAVPMTT